MKLLISLVLLAVTCSAHKLPGGGTHDHNPTAGDLPSHCWRIKVNCDADPENVCCGVGSNVPSQIRPQIEERPRQQTKTADEEHPTLTSYDGRPQIEERPRPVHPPLLEVPLPEHLRSEAEEREDERPTAVHPPLLEVPLPEHLRPQEEDRDEEMPSAVHPPLLQVPLPEHLRPKAADQEDEEQKQPIRTLPAPIPPNFRPAKDQE